MKYEYGNGELSSGHYCRNNMMLCILSGHRNINTKHKRIGLRLHGQTRLQFRRILLINKYGFFDGKERKVCAKEHSRENQGWRCLTDNLGMFCWQ